MNLQRSCIILIGFKTATHTHTNLIMSIKIEKKKSPALIQNGFLTKTIGSSLFDVERIGTCVRGEERKKLSMKQEKGGKSKPYTERTEPARRKLGPGKQLSLGGESQLSRQSL